MGAPLLVFDLLLSMYNGYIHAEIEDSWYALTQEYCNNIQ